MTGIPDDRFILILISIRDKKTMQQMCYAIGKSMGIVQRHLRYMEVHGYVQRHVLPGGIKVRDRGRSLTVSGRKVLKLNGHNSINTEPL